MILSHDAPRATQEGRERISTSLRSECWCKGETCTLVKRMTKGAAWTVALQCDRCGRSISGALKRSDFPGWESLPEWDEGRHDTFMESYRAESVGALAERRSVVGRRLIERRRDYAAWCRTSSEWAELRQAVLRRAGYVCEACLGAPAVTAHHTTYDYGKMPPAWLLKAVCEGCHKRFHADRLGAEDEWCVYSAASEVV